MISSKFIRWLFFDVDDGLLLSEKLEDMNEIMTRMKSEFEIHEVTLTSYLGFQIEKSGKGILLHQSNYIEKVLTTFEMKGCNPAPSQISIQSKETVQSPSLSSDNKYREAVGSLMYLAVTTRPDTMFAVLKVSRKVCDPTKNRLAVGETNISIPSRDNWIWLTLQRW